MAKPQKNIYRVDSTFTSCIDSTTESFGSRLDLLHNFPCNKQFTGLGGGRRGFAWNQDGAAKYGYVPELDPQPAKRSPREALREAMLRRG